MINVSKKVQDIVSESAFTQEGMQSSLLNLSQYAKAIHEEVENRCKKDVKLGTIVVALNRIQKKLADEPSLVLPSIAIQESYIHNDLTEWVVEKNALTQKTLRALTEKAGKDPSGISVTQGMHEMTIIAHKKYNEWMEKSFSKKSIVNRVDGLSNVTVKVSTKYTHTPNVFYALFRSLAAQNINIVEIFSTSSEISLLVSADDIPVLIAALNSFKS
jgi:aspartokinase